MNTVQITLRMELIVLVSKLLMKNIKSLRNVVMKTVNVLSSYKS